MEYLLLICGRLEKRVADKVRNNTYAAATAEYLTNDAIRGGTYDVSTGKFTSATTAPTGYTASADYGASPTLTSFSVVIDPSATATEPVQVYPKDSSSEGTYNKTSN